METFEYWTFLVFGILFHFYRRNSMALVQSANGQSYLYDLGHAPNFYKSTPGRIIECYLHRLNAIQVRYSDPNVLKKYPNQGANPLKLLQLRTTFQTHPKV